MEAASDDSEQYRGDQRQALQTDGFLKASTRTLQSSLTEDGNPHWNVLFNDVVLYIFEQIAHSNMGPGTVRENLKPACLPECSL